MQAITIAIAPAYGFPEVLQAFDKVIGQFIVTRAPVPPSCDQNDHRTLHTDGEVSMPTGYLTATLGTYKTEGILNSLSGKKRMRLRKLRRAHAV
ncbi:hypothetical protein V3C99_015743 [Haemonchus contortus]